MLLILTFLPTLLVAPTGAIGTEIALRFLISGFGRHGPWA
jgi:hypothetical protein